MPTTKRTRVARTTSRAFGAERAARVDVNLWRLAPELTAAQRRRIVAADRKPVQPFASARLMAFAARERSAATAMRALMKGIRHDVRKLDRKLVSFEYRHVDQSPFLALSRIGDLLSQIAVVTMDHAAENVSRRPGRPRDHEARERVSRVAALFGEFKLPTPRDPQKLFGRVVRAVLYKNGAGTPTHYLRPYA